MTLLLVRYKRKGDDHGKDFDVAQKPALAAMTAGRRRLFYGAAFAPALLLAGCAVKVENTQAAQEVARLSRPHGSVSIGWRVFQTRCASCHGVAATGTASGPDLLPRVREMGSREFVSLVLKRYDWSLPAVQAGSEGAAREALIDEFLQRRGNFMPTMPPRDGEPIVTTHIVDLHAYLSARAQGTQGPGRPLP